MLTKNIASEYGEYNIQCNGIGPGYIATPQTAPPYVNARPMEAGIPLISLFLQKPRRHVGEILKI